MIARVWRGVTPASKAEQYAAYLESTGVKECRATEGNLGVQILRRIHGDQAEFVFTSFWESLDVIRNFAGPEIDKAVYYPEDTAYLIELEPTVRHYEVLVERDSR